MDIQVTENSETRSSKMLFLATLSSLKSESQISMGEKTVVRLKDGGTISYPSDWDGRWTQKS